MNASVEEWDGGFHTFLRTAQDQRAPPWTLPYEERRLLSKEERVVKQMALESSWTLTPTFGLWKRLRVFAAPHQDFVLARGQFFGFLNSIGITSTTLHGRLWDLFTEDPVKCSSQPLNALCFAKRIDVGLSDELTRHYVLRHCFNALPLSRADLSGTPPSDDVLIVADIRRALDHRGVGKTSLSALLAPELLTTLSSWLTDRQLTVVSFNDFSAMFMSTTAPNFGELFTKQIIEACGKYFKEPFGSLPRISSKWLEDLAPISFDPAAPADADALLLQEAERLGLVDSAKTVKKKKRKIPPRK